MDKSVVDVVGDWWLPGNEDHKVAGWFTYDHETGGTLRLNGQLPTSQTIENVLDDGTVQRVIHYASGTPEYPVIYGEAENKCYTLFDAFQTKHRVTWPRGKGIENVYANVCVSANAWFPDKDDLGFDRLIVSVRHLTEWVDNSGLLATWHPTPSDTTEFARITAHTRDRLISEEAPDGLPQVTFTYNAKEAGNRLTNLILEQRWDARFIADPEGQSFEALINAAIDLQRLITIGVGHPAVLETVKPQHPDLVHDAKADPPRRLPIDYYARWTLRAPDREPVNPLHMYFTLTDLGGIDTVQRWLTVANHYRSELGRIMATRSRDMFLEDKIANLCAALEGIDKVRRNTPRRKPPHFIERVKATIEYAGDPFRQLIPDVDSWAKEVKTARNDIDHHNEVFRLNDTVGENDLDERLYWLLIFTLLRLANAPDAVLSKIAEHNKTRHLRDHNG